MQSSAGFSNLFLFSSCEGAIKTRLGYVVEFAKRTCVWDMCVCVHAHVW
jgi:hypothetical protein